MERVLSFAVLLAKIVQKKEGRCKESSKMYVLQKQHQDLMPAPPMVVVRSKKHSLDPSSTE